ncbi:MAG: cation transporter [Firmicutes bacterium HGW-Firmicutes-7]|nr:MAG: cation transporter [Firmicutes bacterium HGW-Firmicutes-7]
MLVAVMKIFIGSVVHSVSITADGFHSLSDATSNIVGLIGIKIAARPIDEKHPYGHRKFETLSGLFISVMLFYIALKTIYFGILRLVYPRPIIISMESVVVLLITIGINLVVAVYEYKKGLVLNSEVLISDAIHTRSDIFVSIGVLISILCIKLGVSPVIDAVSAVVIAAFIFHAAFEIFISASSVLVDKRVIDEHTLKQIVMSYSQVKEAHKIRSRGKKDDIFVDMHILTDPGMSIEESHTLMHNIEEKIKEDLNSNIQLIVHFEPFYT